MNELLRERYEKLKIRQKCFLLDYEELEEIADKPTDDNKENEYCFESQFDMNYPTDIWCEQFANTTYESPIYVFGIGHYLYLKKMIKSVQFGVIVVYEPDLGKFVDFFQNEVEDIIDTKGVYFIAGEKRQRLLRESLDNFLNYNNRRQFYVANIPNYIKCYEDDYEEFCNIIKTKRDNIMIEKNTQIKHEKMHSYNYLNNIFSMFDEAGIKELCDSLNAFTEYPAVIVSAGPSLDKNVKQLKSYKGHVFIVAVEAALNTLKVNDIIPDLIVTIDPSFEKIKAMEDERYNNLPMIVNTVSGYKLLKRHKGRKFFDVQQDNVIGNIVDKYQKRIPILGTGGSVANTAFSFLEFAGFKTIILIGQDLSYPDNRVHASGAFENEKDIDELSSKYYYVEDIHGGKVLTEKDMDLYRLWFEDTIRESEDEQLLVIDATEGGALIDGTIIMALSEALCKYAMTEEVNFTEAINKAQYLFDEEERKIAKQEFAGYYENVEQEISKLKKGKRLYDKLEELFYKRKTNTRQYRKIIDNIKEFSGYMYSNPQISIFELYSSKERMDVVEQMMENKGDSAYEIHNVAESGRKMIDAYIVAGERIKEEWERYKEEEFTPAV